MSTHRPVLREEVLDLLARRPDGLPAPRLVDCTLGGGGHAAALLEACPGAELLALDRDSSALERAAPALARFGGRVELVHGDYRELARIIEKKAGRGASAASSRTSGSRATSSTTRSAASRSGTTGPSTCGWTARAAGRQPLSSSEISRRASWPTCSGATGTSRTLGALRSGWSRAGARSLS